MSRYSAQKQFWKAKQAKHEKDKIADVVLLQKLQVQETNTFSAHAFNHCLRKSNHQNQNLCLYLVWVCLFLKQKLEQLYHVSVEE